MRILGIDSSLTGTGLAGAELLPWPPSRIPRQDGQPVSHTIGLSTVGARKPKLTDTWLATSERIHEVLDKIDAAVCEHVYDAVGLEGLSFGSKGDAVVKLNWLWGEIIYLVHRRGAPLYLIPPSNVKKFATGNGNANKDVVMLAMANRYPHAGIADNNQSDALAVCMMTARQVGVPFDTMPVKHLEAMSKVAPQ